MNAFSELAEAADALIDALFLSDDGEVFSFGHEAQTDAGAALDWIQQALAGDHDTVSIKGGEFVDLWSMAHVGGGDIDIFDAEALIDGSLGLTFGLVDLLGDAAPSDFNLGQFAFDGLEDGVGGDIDGLLGDGLDDDAGLAGTFTFDDGDLGGPVLSRGDIDAPEAFGLSIRSGDTLAESALGDVAPSGETFDFGADGDLDGLV